tara:strand:- start:3004 stop:3684 length:681 start_codon:yes stop_codon:yes gene_type:complete
MRVLIVEDSQYIRESVALVLRESGYAVDESGDGEEGLWKAQSNPYDVIILDIMLPGLDGLSALRKLRQEGNQTQILILSARDTTDDRIKGLRHGADDYLVKPFDLGELLARVEALCRRTYKKKNPELRIGGLTINLQAKTVSCGEQTINMTAREYAILEFLALRQGEVVSRTEIEAHVYDELVSPVSNVIDKSICVLRKKLTEASDAAPVIQTRRGQGYIIEADQT